MKQNNREGRTITENVTIIDKISVPQKAIVPYSEKSLFIRNILRQQPGFLKYKIFQQTCDSGDLQVITIATWADRQRMEDAGEVIREAMRKAGINMPVFLEKHGITMERGIYQTVEE